MKQKNEPLYCEDERDLRKPRYRVHRTGTGEDSIHRFSSATAELCGGIAEAISKAFRRFGNEITAENAARIGLSNGFVAGFVAANSDFFQEISKTSERVYETMKHNDRKEENFESIDYDRLARLVVAEMIKADIMTEPVAKIKVDIEQPLSNLSSEKEPSESNIIITDV